MNALQNARKYPANTRKRPQGQTTGNSYEFLLFSNQGNCFFPFFCYIDGLVENMKIHTQAMRLCHQYAWVKGRILGCRAPKELEEPQPGDMIFFKQP